eukprot:COSAG01_NODE_6667_length_3555_cov_33.351273_4_plen_68_part_00
MNNFLQKGIALIQEATTADQAGDFPTAMNKYMQGLEYFNYAHERERVRPAQQLREEYRIRMCGTCFS